LAVEVEPEAKPGKQHAVKLAWPKTLSERVKAVSTALATVKEPVTAAEMAKQFAQARAAGMGEILRAASPASTPQRWLLFLCTASAALFRPERGQRFGIGL
jgi:hypothetical protein